MSGHLFRHGRLCEFAHKHPFLFCVPTNMRHTCYVPRRPRAHRPQRERSSMKKFSNFVHTLLPSRSIDPELAARKEIYREWDRERRRAVSASDLAEIDAIFSRAL